MRNHGYKDILGLNRRNQEYVRPYNPPSAKRIADNKILTKRVLRREGIKTPEVYKLIRTKKQLQFLDWDSLPKSFVIKPNKGTGGNGIIVFYGKEKGQNAWIRPNGRIMTQRDIILHIENILEGRYSMGSKRDIAIIEERVRTDPLLKQYSYKGVPDIRIICFNSIPIMAMTRLPTKRSNGTANLHTGAICTGIDIGTGITTYSMHMNPNTIISDTYQLIDKTMDLKQNKLLSGIQIPNWDNLLEIALKCQKYTGLGYIGVDIAIDRDKGPIVFEVNARPGLGIQVANQAGLRWRLEKAKGLDVKSIKHGLRLGKNLFGGEVEESIESISGRKVVNIVEKVIVYHKPAVSMRKKKQKIKVDKEITNSFMDTGVLTSRISSSLANRIGFRDTTKFFKNAKIPKSFDTFKEAQEYIDTEGKKIIEHEDIERLAKVVEDGQINIRPVIKIVIKLSGDLKDIETVITDDIIYPLVIGRKELAGYLVDTTKTFK
ncbi:MAG: alpha-L-glutamate ligase [candidate division WS6 bacterium 34_10]|uniref:Alpha-L-glutamate ligase n=1 Tax=candidate division WS6 bacterium 34_10 TaxID=1641389 RepID=A0A101HIY9_9BACT|nr:MAG: alpha-L-glutamate ligase [candidate division WS6 bacterium 34_10]